jgi:phosphoglycerate dehydrogenase-like enzyme
MNQPSIEVLITMPFEDALLEKLRQVSPRLNVVCHPANKTEDIPADLWNKAEVLYTAGVIPSPEQVPNLRWVQFHFAGIDYAVNTPLLANPNLIATTLSGAAVSQMGEYAISMLLALGHHLPGMHFCQQKSDWPRDRWERFSPMELRGSTVGIVGYGSVGRHIARLLHAFGATILAAKHDVMTLEDTGYTQSEMGDPEGVYFHRLYPFQAVGSMLKDCDFIVITAPLTPQTRGLIGAEQFAHCKSTAYLVDISRGGVVDHTALIEALQSRKLAGAALDVFPEEPLPTSSPLWGMPNVIITPHLSGNSPHYFERAVALFSENLNRYMAGLPLYNRFDPQKGY